MWGGNTEGVCRIRGRTRFSPADACAASNSSLDTHSLTRPSPWMPLDAASHRRRWRCERGSGREGPRQHLGSAHATSRARCSVVHRAGRLGSARALAIASPRDRTSALDESMRSARGGWWDRGDVPAGERDARGAERGGKVERGEGGHLFYRRGTRGWVGAEAKARLGRTLEKTTTRLDDELGACADACGDTRALVASVDWPRNRSALGSVVFAFSEYSD